MLVAVFFLLVRFAAKVLQGPRGEQFVKGGSAPLHAFDFFFGAADTIAEARNLARQSCQRTLRFVLRLGGSVARREQVATRPKSLYCCREPSFGLPELLLFRADLFHLAA